MNHETHEGYGKKEVVINDLINDNLKKKGAASKGQILGKMFSQGLLHQKVNLETEYLVNKKSLNQEEHERLSKKINDIQNELIEGMSHFDDNLKLRLQMNVDLVSQDQEVWHEKMLRFVGNIKNNLKIEEFKKLNSEQL